MLTIKADVLIDSDDKDCYLYRYNLYDNKKIIDINAGPYFKTIKLIGVKVTIVLNFIKVIYCKRGLNVWDSFI